MPGKTILILGAGRDQLFLIKTAKKLGMNVIAVDKNKEAKGAELADKFINTSTRNVAGISEALSNLGYSGMQIDGVITMGSDIPEVVAEISQSLNLPSLSMESASSAKNKYKMKQRFQLGGVSTAKFMLLSETTELKDAFSILGEKLVIKPLDQAGSRGVYLLRENTPNIYQLFDDAKRYSSNAKVLAEEYIEGPQISTEHILFEGKLYTPGFADRNYENMQLFLPQIIENGGWVPSLFENLRHKIEAEIKKVAKALDLNNCVIKGDIVVKDGKPIIIEIAARLSGGDFSESLVPIGLGINYVETALNIAVGVYPDLNKLKPNRNLTVANRYFYAPQGKLKRIIGIENILSKPWIHKVQMWIKPGDVLGKINSHSMRSGVFVVSGKSRTEVQKRINYVYRSVKFHMD